MLVESRRGAAETDATPIRIETHTCHSGGGVEDVIRSNIVKLLMGGMKLMNVANIEFGSRLIGSHSIHGIIITIITGIMKD